MSAKTAPGVVASFLAVNVAGAKALQLRFKRKALSGFDLPSQQWPEPEL